MQSKSLSVMISLAVALFSSIVFAQDKSPAELGRELFNNPNFAGGQRACNDCHPNGRNLAKIATKTSFTFMGMENRTLEEVVNLCIVNSIKGSPIPVDSKEMKEVVSYIRSLAPKKPVQETNY